MNSNLKTFGEIADYSYFSHPDLPMTLYLKTQLLTILVGPSSMMQVNAMSTRNKEMALLTDDTVVLPRKVTAQPIFTGQKQITFNGGSQSAEQV